MTIKEALGHKSLSSTMVYVTLGRGNAVSYLARYSYRTAISNSRIRGYDNSTVTFEYKDYRDGGKTKTMTVSGMEFIRRFLKHVLPSAFFSYPLSNFLLIFAINIIYIKLLWSHYGIPVSASVAGSDFCPRKNVS